MVKPALPEPVAFLHEHELGPKFADFAKWGVPGIHDKPLCLLEDLLIAYELIAAQQELLRNLKGVAPANVELLRIAA